MRISFVAYTVGFLSAVTVYLYAYYQRALALSRTRRAAGKGNAND